MRSACSTCCKQPSSLLTPQVPEAVCLESLSYHEAWELSYFGASVLHPRTTMPAMKFNIPISIRNFFNQGSPGALLACWARWAALKGLPFSAAPAHCWTGIAAK